MALHVLVPATLFSLTSFLATLSCLTLLNPRGPISCISREKRKTLFHVKCNFNLYGSDT